MLAETAMSSSASTHLAVPDPIAELVVGGRWEKDTLGESDATIYCIDMSASASSSSSPKPVTAKPPQCQCYYLKTGPQGSGIRTEKEVIEWLRDIVPVPKVGILGLEKLELSSVVKP